MTEGPFPKILNRVQARVDAGNLIDTACPLLEELVDYATWVWRRCEMAGNTTYEDMPAFVIYPHSIEITDGVEVLIAQSCCEPTVPLIRSSFEAFISLQYLLDDDYKNRSLSWLYFDHLRASKKYRQLDPESS